MLTGALYIRVSTDDQTEFSPDAQKRQLMEYAVKNDIIISNEFIYIDEGISGRDAKKRPAFQQMISTAKKKPKPFDVILVHKFDRFARSREDSVVYKSLLRRECDIKVVSISEQMEDDKFSVILEAMLEAMAEYYSLNLSDEVMKGMTEKAMRGEYQTYAPYGYKMIDGKLFIDSEKAETVKMIFDEYVNKDSSPFKIAKTLNALGLQTTRKNLFESRTVMYILKNPAYIGKVRWNVTNRSTRKVKDESEWITVKGDYEPIITEELFNLAEAKRKSTYRPLKSKPRDINKHWLSGVLRCSNCGKTLVYHENKNRKGFQCWLYTKGTCSISHYVSEYKIVNAVLESLGNMIDSGDIEYVARNDFDGRNEIALLQKEFEHIQVKERRSKDAYLNGIDSIEEYRHNKSLLAKEAESISAKIENLESKSKRDTKPDMLSGVQEVYRVISSDECSKEEKSAAISSIASEIIYSKPDESIDIHLYF